MRELRRLSGKDSVDISSTAKATAELFLLKSNESSTFLYGTDELTLRFIVAKWIPRVGLSTTFGKRSANVRIIRATN